MAPLVLVGGDSRAAAAIAARNAGRRIVLVVRRGGSGERATVRDYREIPDGLKLAGATVVNCVGIDRGPPQELHRANVEVPLNWVHATARMGGRLFVQISSFSVYGRRELIGHDTPPAPESDYGRSKRDAEVALSSLNIDAAISVLRVPILVSPAGAAGPPDKLAQLARLAARAHVVPAPARPVERSMISYDAMARAVALLEAEPQPLAVAADPEPFTYDLLAAAALAGGSRVVRVPVPRLATQFLAPIAPGIVERLFASNVLADEANLLAKRDDFARLPAIIASHFPG